MRGFLGLFGLLDLKLGVISVDPTRSSGTYLKVLKNTWPSYISSLPWTAMYQVTFQSPEPEPQAAVVFSLLSSVRS